VNDEATARTAPSGAQPSSEEKPARVLAMDVGAGTTDILLTRPGQPLENAVKLVVPSRTQVVAAQIDQATARGQAIVFYGPTMGGGACAAAARRHLAAGLPLLATEEAALTFSDNLVRVQESGVTLVDESELTARLGALPQGSVVLRSGDVPPEALGASLALLGADREFDAVAVAVQDHGFSPYESNRAVRFALWEAAVTEKRRLAELFFTPAEIPARLTRLRAAARQAEQLAAGAPVLAADTGPAALYGALPAGDDDAVLVNIGNGHTFCVVALDGRLVGVYEHHTGLLTRERLEHDLRRFLAGTLDGAEVLADGGHGAVMAPAAAARAALPLPILVTGPRRALLEGSSLPYEFAAPHGDMMLTGCFGLLRAVRERFSANDAAARP
jgi:uncharacterized protein (DUF1786 family)